MNNIEQQEWQDAIDKEFNKLFNLIEEF